MMAAFLLTLTTMTLGAALWARRLRPVGSHISLVEVFILGHLYFFVFCAATSDFHWSGAEMRDLWRLPLLLGVVFLGVCIGAWIVRMIPGRREVPHVKTIEDERPAETMRVLLLAVLFLGVTTVSLMGHPKSPLELIQLHYWERVFDPSYRVPFFLLNGLSIVPVALLSARVVRSGRPASVATVVLFLLATTIHVIIGVVTGARNRILYAIVAIGYLWYLGASRRSRKYAIAACAIALPAFVLISYPWRVYRDTGDLSEAIHAGKTASWYEEWTDDPTNNAVDFCLLSMSHYPHMGRWRGWDGIVGVVGWLIPRRIWPGKPLGYGNVMWMDVIGNTSAVGVGPTFLGEFYVCAGAWGLFPISLCFGFVLASCQRIIARFAPPLDYFALHACLMYAAFIVVRGDFTSTFGRTFMLILPSYFGLNWIATQVSRVLVHSSNARHA